MAETVLSLPISTGLGVAVSAPVVPLMPATWNTIVAAVAVEPAPGRMTTRLPEEILCWTRIVEGAEK